jgi:hypothetical protein
MQKSDPILMGIVGSLYFGIVGALLAWAADAGTMWEAIAGLAGALLGGVYLYVAHAVFGDQTSMKGGAYRVRLYLWVVWCALLGAALFAVRAAGAAKLTNGLVGLVAGALVGLVLGGIHNSFVLGVRALMTSVVKAPGHIGGLAVFGGLGAGWLAWELWSRWSRGNGHAIIGGVIAGLIIAVVIATLAWSSSGRSRKGNSSKSLE